MIGNYIEMHNYFTISFPHVLSLHFQIIHVEDEHREIFTTNVFGFYQTCNSARIILIRGLLDYCSTHIW